MTCVISTHTQNSHDLHKVFPRFSQLKLLKRNCYVEILAFHKVYKTRGDSPVFYI
jgi:hypothetical protein